jgi:hypothetical protein
LTLAVVFTMARSFAAASLERCSWMKAVVIARTTMIAMTTAAPDVTKKIGNRGEREQQGIQGILGPPPQFSQDARASLAGDDVRSDRRQPCLGLGGLEPVGRSPKPWTDPGFLRLAHSENLIRQDDVGIACLDAALGRRLAKVQAIKESRAIYARRLFDVRLGWTDSDRNSLD